jgi:twitching motility protein PilU
MYNAELLEEAKTFMFHMLTKVVEYGGSDLFITADFPPSIKLQGLMRPLGQQN